MAQSNGDKEMAEKAAKKWTDDKTSDILATFKQDFPYPTTWTRDTTDPKVKSYIRRYFGNKLQGSLVRTGIVQPGVGERSNNALFTAKPLLTARQLYEKEEKDEVLTLADKSSGNTAGRYQTALRTLWTTTEIDVKQKFENQARENALHVDISRNQRDFEANIGGTLQDLCTNGALGPAEMVLLASYRNTAGELCTLAVHGHSDENPEQKSFADFAPEFSAVRTQWDNFCGGIIPRPHQDREGWAAIPKNAAGIPIFPSVDFDSATRYCCSSRVSCQCPRSGASSWFCSSTYASTDFTSASTDFTATSPGITAAPTDFTAASPGTTAASPGITAASTDFAVATACSTAFVSPVATTAAPET
ncbi:hypothetical protein B0H10DRAFT_2442183, partial [Mycena sp. CBHHK59/15]